MIAHLSSLTVDPLGSVWLDLMIGSALHRAGRRVTRVKTLDGGYALNDYGYAHCDRDAVLYWRSDATTDYLVRRLMELYGQIYVALAEGLFLASIESMDTAKDRSSARLMLLQKMTT